MNPRLIALGRDVAFAMRDGRKAREAGTPMTSNPYAYAAIYEPTGDGRAHKLYCAWGDGWRLADRYMRKRKA